MQKLKETLLAWGPLGVFLMAILDSAGVPNPGGTDALLLLVTIGKPDTVWICAALAVLGSLIGSVIFWYIARTGGRVLLDKRLNNPRGQKVREWYARYGLASVFVAALIPFPFMPLKALALCAGALGVRLVPFLLVMLAARLPRYFAMAYLGSQLGENSSAWLKQHAWQMGLMALGLMLLLFAVIKIADRNRSQRALE
jgi:membrane protein YqaA with SNARE-associated domain